MSVPTFEELLNGVIFRVYNATLYIRSMRGMASALCAEQAPGSEAYREAHALIHQLGALLATFENEVSAYESLVAQRAQEEALQNASREEKGVVH